jgi:hypothetical protein
LESLGYRAATRGGGKGKGPRYRCWVRELTEEDTAPLPPAVFDPLAAAPVAPFTRPIVDEANAAPYEPIVSHGQQGYPDGVVIPATPTPAAPVPLAKMGERPMTDPEGAKPYVAPVCHGQQYQGYPPKWVKVTDGGA